MIEEPGARNRSLVDDYCIQLGILLERRTTQLALIAAKEQAERAAAIAEEAAHQAREADRAKTHFLANMTHELRTPLNAIIGFSELIETGSKHAETAGHAKYIRDSGQHLLGIVNRVLALARIESGKLILEPQPVAIAELFDAAIRPVRPEAAHKGIAIKSTGELGCPVVVDVARMAQALTNLLTNAITYTPDGGVVELEAEPLGDGQLAIRVRDNGSGIADDDIERVLRPFGQAGEVLTRETGGIGLGLPIARGLVALHRGDLSIASRPGRGTTVEIRLPASCFQQSVRP